MPHDVRAVANFVLDYADGGAQAITNLALNKVVYFLHANYVVQFDRPLVSAKIEAWNYGPVFRELYREFKSFGDKPISTRASRIDPTTGSREICKYQFDESEKRFLESLVKEYVRLSPGMLVSMSHVKGGPWDQVWNHSSRARPSMHISDDLIKMWHKDAARH